MDKNKKEILLSEAVEDLNPYRTFKTVAEKRLGQWQIKVTTDNINIDQEKAERLINNVHKAAQIAFDINKGPIGGYDSELTVRFPEGGTGVLMQDFNADKQLLEEDDDSQTAVVIHEMVHAIEEEIPDYYKNNYQETVTLAAEFIFGGKSRIPYFRRLTDDVITDEKEGKGLVAHPLGWKQSLHLLQDAADTEIDFLNDDSSTIIKKITQLKELQNSEKIRLIQSFIEQGKKVPDQDSGRSLTNN